jgi:hypothetical protein
MITSKIPDRPWVKFGVDLFEHKTHYLLSVDYHFKWIEIAKLEWITKAARTPSLTSKISFPDMVYQISY